jgi:hypothetical protein
LRRQIIVDPGPSVLRGSCLPIGRLLLDARVEAVNSGCRASRLPHADEVILVACLNARSQGGHSSTTSVGRRRPAE